MKEDISIRIRTWEKNILNFLKELDKNPQQSQYFQKIHDFKVKLIKILDIIIKNSIDVMDSFNHPNVEIDEKIESLKEQILQPSPYSKKNIQDFKSIIRESPYSNLVIYKQIDHFFDQMISVLYDNLPISHFIPDYQNFPMRLQKIKKLLQKFEYSKKNVDFSICEYWQSNVHPFIEFILHEYLVIENFLENINRKFQRLLKNSDILSSKQELLLPIYNLGVQTLSSKNLILLQNNAINDLNKILIKCGQYNFNSFRLILSFYNRFMEERQNDLLQNKTKIMQSMSNIMEFVLPEITDNFFHDKFPLIKIVKKWDNLTNLMHFAQDKAEVENWTEDEYQQNVNLKFDLFLNLFEINRIFYKFILYSLLIVRNPSIQIKVKQSNFGWDSQHSVRKLFKEIQRNDLLKRNYPAFFKMLSLNYRNLQKFRNFKAHDQPLIKQTLYLQKKVIYFQKNKKKTIKYEKFEEICKEALYFIKHSEQIITSYFEFFKVKESRNGS